MVEFLRVRISYVILRDHCCDIIALKIHAPTEDKIGDMKDSFYEELGRVIDYFHKHHTEILLGYCMPN
jgi:hypothetical protein